MMAGTRNEGQPGFLWPRDAGYMLLCGGQCHMQFMCSVGLLLDCLLPGLFCLALRLVVIVVVWWL